MGFRNYRPREPVQKLPPVFFPKRFWWFRSLWKQPTFSSPPVTEGSKEEKTKLRGIWDASKTKDCNIKQALWFTPRTIQCMPKKLNNKSCIRFICSIFVLVSYSSLCITAGSVILGTDCYFLWNCPHSCFFKHPPDVTAWPMRFMSMHSQCVWYCIIGYAVAFLLHLANSWWTSAIHLQGTSFLHMCNKQFTLLIKYLFRNRFGILRNILRWFFLPSGVFLFLRKCADRPTSFFWVVFISVFF